jgi:hypothetical protein
MGRLKDKDWFKLEELTELQKELMVKCLSHDLRWAREMLEWYMEGRWYAHILKGLYRMFIWLVERRGREARLFEPSGRPVTSAPSPVPSAAVSPSG